MDILKVIMFPSYISLNFRFDLFSVACGGRWSMCNGPVCRSQRTSSIDMSLGH